VQNSIYRAVTSWLNRTTSNHDVRFIQRVQAVIGTARGRVRSENQDRAVAAVFDGDNPNFDFCAFIVCDGLGGMRDGGLCAASATAHYLAHLVSTAHVQDRAFRLRRAMTYANEKLAQEFHERGGTTLTAVLFTSTGVTAAAVGDTRIYKQGEKGELRQLTVDDTIAARVAALRPSSVREPSPPLDSFSSHLAQFIGQGSPIDPQIVSPETLIGGPVQGIRRGGLLVTTDGVHRLGPDLLPLVARTSTSAKELVQRLITVADWAAGLDNATAIWVSPQTMPGDLVGVRSSSPTLQLYDAHGDFYIDSPHAEIQDVTSFNRPSSTVGTRPVERGPKPDPRRKRPAVKGSKKKKKGAGRRGRSAGREDEQPELDIEITQRTE
jgi:PPM family protein phosphatase